MAISGDTLVVGRPFAGLGEAVVYVKPAGGWGTAPVTGATLIPAQASRYIAGDSGLTFPNARAPFWPRNRGCSRKHRSQRRMRMTLAILAGASAGTEDDLFSKGYSAR